MRAMKHNTFYNTHLCNTTLSLTNRIVSQHLLLHTCLWKTIFNVTLRTTPNHTTPLSSYSMCAFTLMLMILCMVEPTNMTMNTQRGGKDEGIQKKDAMYNIGRCVLLCYIVLLFVVLLSKRLRRCLQYIKEIK